MRDTEEQALELAKDREALLKREEEQALKRSHGDRRRRGEGGHKEGRDKAVQDTREEAGVHSAAVDGILYTPRLTLAHLVQRALPSFSLARSIMEEVRAHT